MKDGRELRAWVIAVGVLCLTGCEDPPPPEACAGPDDPSVALANRDEGRNELVVGGEIEVFDAPQGGVFAELDVTVSDMGLSELEYLRVTVDDPNTGEQLAFARYFGNSVPLRCSEDGLLEMSRMPLGFVQMYRVEDLDGRAVTLTGALETETDEFPTEYEVVLRGVPY